MASIVELHGGNSAGLNLLMVEVEFEFDLVVGFVVEGVVVVVVVVGVVVGLVLVFDDVEVDDVLGKVVVVVMG